MRGLKRPLGAKLPAMRLCREIRAFLTNDPVGEGNSWGGVPAGDRLEPFVAIRAEVEGEVDPATGYLVNIKVLDRFLRERVLPPLIRATLQEEDAVRSPPGRVPWPAALLGAFKAAIASPLQEVNWVALEVRPSPFCRYRVEKERALSVVMTQSFEFSAAHRLYRPDWSDEENRRIFGKCSNPAGHGHNYILEVTLCGRADPATGRVVDPALLEGVVRDRVIDRFDHRHLNLDCPEFATLNPTMENIVRVIFGLIEGRFGPARLESVRVWETPKTWAEQRAENRQ